VNRPAPASTFRSPDRYGSVNAGTSQASLVWDGGGALILNERGELLLAELKPEGGRVLGRAAVLGPTWAHPAYAGRCLFARNDEEVVCVPLDGP
jgi:hypothetical protein